MAAAREEKDVHIMHMKSPSSFWVTDSKVVEDAEEDPSEVIRLERALARINNRSRHYTKLQPIMPNEGELVAVRHPVTGQWHRGKVDCVLETSTGFEYHIFLVDHGYPLKKIRISAIRNLPEEFKQARFAAYEVVLDDIVPLTVKMDFLYQKMVPCVASSWPVAAWNFVNQLVGQGRPAVLKINCIRNNVVLGDLFLDGTLSVSEMLCKEEYATRSREDFEKVFSEIDSRMSTYYHNLEQKEKSPPEKKTEQKFLVDYVQEQEKKQNSPKLQELKEKIGNLLDDDCSPSVGRGVKRHRQQSSVGLLANNNQQERRRVSEVGRRNGLGDERETCDSEDGLRKLSLDESDNRTSPRNAPNGVDAEGNTSATESIDKDGYTSTDSNSTVSSYLQVLSRAKQVKSQSQNVTSVAESKEITSSDKTLQESFNTSKSRNDMSRSDETMRRHKRYNRTPKDIGNKRASANNESSESRSNTTDSCDETEGSRNYNRNNEWLSKDNYNRLQPVNKELVHETVNKKNKTSPTVSSESTGTITNPSETEKTNKDSYTVPVNSPSCLVYLKALSKAKPVKEPTLSTPSSEMVQKTVAESTELKTSNKIPPKSFENNESRSDTYKRDETRKGPTNQLLSKDNWNREESVINVLMPETKNTNNNKFSAIGKTSPKCLVESVSATTNTSEKEERNDSACTSSAISQTCSMYLEALNKAKQTKQPTHNMPQSELPQKTDISFVETSQIRTNDKTLSRSSDINSSRNDISDNCNETSNKPCDYNRGKQSVSKDNRGGSELDNNGPHESANKGKTSPRNKIVSFSANTSGTDNTNEEGYASTDSSSHYLKPPGKARTLPRNRTHQSDISVAENRRSNLIATRAESKTLRELVSGESLMASVRILVHGEVRVKPIESIYTANFPKEIHGALTKMGFRVPHRIQKYAWPAILRGQNIILVGPRSSGKTISCLVPLLSFMTMKQTYSELGIGSGPYVVILCSGCKSAQQTYETCETIMALAGHTDVRILVAYGGGQELQIKTELVNGCDILISTPKCLLRLLRYSKYMTNLNRLAHLFFDEVDVLAFKYLPEVKEIINECKLMLKDRAKLQMPVQVLAASEKWTIAVEQFAKNISKNFFVCISGYLEAAVYAKLQPKLHFETKETKGSTVLRILEGSQGMYKVVIVCQYIDEVEHLLQYFKVDTYEVLFAHENVSHDTITAIKQHWKHSTIPGCHPVLVCTDGILPDLEIYDAMWLIHYSMPYTKTAFGFRFSCLMDNYNNMFKPMKDDPDKPYCSVHILLDDTADTKELPEVVRFVKRSGVPVDPALEIKAAKVQREKELCKSGVPLCYNLKAFGDCWESSTCRSRHVIIQAEDEPKNIPLSGEVTIKVMSVIDASRFSARILDHKDNNNIINTYPNNYFAVTHEVLRFYENKDNRIPHGIPKLGDLCAVEVGMKFYRAKVTEIVMLDKHNMPKVVNVHLLDEGTTEEARVFQLLELPDKLKEAVPQVVEVFLCNIMPCDKDWSWSAMATCRMADWIEKLTDAQDEDRCLRGQIKLSLGNTLWLDPLECCTYLENINAWVKDCSLSRDLVAVKLAVKNPEHMKRLYQLCEEAGIALPHTSETKRETAPVHQPHRKAAPKQPQWAHLDKEEYQQVVFICADSPSRIFVRLLKFQDSLQRLMNELQQNADDPEDFQAEAGVYCIAKFVDDGKWNRAKVLEVLDNKRVKVFYVDHGDTDVVDADQVAAIKEKYITKLPFQAIECSLIGVKPTEDDGWSEEATDAIYDFGESGTLFVKICQTEPTASLTGGKLYKVILVDTSTPVDLMLNRILVKKGLAVSVEDELKVYENVSVTKEAEVLDNEEVRAITSASQPPKNHSMAVPGFDLENCDVAIEDIQEFAKYFGMVAPVKDQKEEEPEVKKNAVDDVRKSCSSDGIVSAEDDDGPPPLASKTKIPMVSWYQDECFVYLRIMLTGIRQYHLSWDVTTLEFCVEVMEQTYSLKMELYSGVEAENLIHICKGLYLQITLKKISKGYLWPRLLLSEGRYLWIKKDLQMFKQESESEEEETVASRCRKATKAVCENTIPSKAEHLKRDEHIVPDILALESDSECESDPWEPAEETVDFYDPLC